MKLDLTTEELRDLLFRHRLVTFSPHHPMVPSTFKCGCGVPFLNEKQWAAHVAEVLELEE